MKMLRLLTAAFLAIAPAVAFAQTTAPVAAPAPNATAQAGWDKAAPMTVAVQAPPTQGGGVLNIGQAFGPLLQPYVDALVQSGLAALAGWVCWVLQTKFKVNIDEGHRDAWLTAAQNQAHSLVADGFVRVEQNGKLTVPPGPLNDAAAALINSVPDAVNHFGLTPQAVADKIMDMLPKVPAVAQAQSVAIAAAPAPAQPAAPAVV